MQGYPDITNNNRPTLGAYCYIQLLLELWEFRRTMVTPEYPAFKYMAGPTELTPRLNSPFLAISGTLHAQQRCLESSPPTRI